ncbi:hypothetical protein FJY68_07900 [candidate division WOR-3 bacterium]|uniref:Bulb-type lectin domain-containing protein n=1 Tax=candidate division WOR-3 bacterium TaxID=2052148 RepID=A0A937XGR4_UNCW3|nr:hypothetical protein [candidate division WOR-3 bacterium]
MRISIVAVGSATLAVICMASIASAQTGWWRTYGGPSDDDGRSIQQTADDGYIVAGWTKSFGAGYADVCLIKTNAQGDSLWVRTYGGPNQDGGNSVQQTTDGGYIIAGGSGSFGAGLYDVYLVKTDASGDTLWTRTYGGTDQDMGNSVQQTADGGYIITGCTKSFGAGNWDVYLVKTNALGDTVWTRTYGGAQSDWGYSVQQTADSGYVIAGYGAGNADVYLIKTNAQGDTLWTRTYGGSRQDVAYSLQLTADGGYIIAGETDSYGAANGDVYLIKVNPQGDTLWARTYGGPNYDDGRSVQQTTDGGYVIAGITQSFGAGNSDVYLVKINALGDTVWTATYGGPQSDAGYSVQQTADGGYVVSGGTYSFGAGTPDSDNVYLIKTDSLGTVGVLEENPGQQAVGRKPAATVVRRLPQGASVFDALGRRVQHPRPGVYFVREPQAQAQAQAQATRKVLLVE